MKIDYKKGEIDKIKELTDAIDEQLVLENSEEEVAAYVKELAKRIKDKEKKIEALQEQVKELESKYETLQKTHTRLVKAIVQKRAKVKK